MIRTFGNDKASEYIIWMYACIPMYVLSKDEHIFIQGYYYYYGWRVEGEKGILVM